MISAIILVIISIFFPPLTVGILAGCGADLLINIILCVLAVFPGHIHAFYLMYVYYKRQEDAERGILDDRPAPFVFSDKVNRGGVSESRIRRRQQDAVAPSAYGGHQQPQHAYGTMPPQSTAYQQQAPPPQQGYHAQEQGFAPPPQYHDAVPAKR